MALLEDSKTKNFFSSSLAPELQVSSSCSSTHENQKTGTFSMQDLPKMRGLMSDFFPEVNNRARIFSQHSVKNTDTSLTVLRFVRLDQDNGQEICDPLFSMMYLFQRTIHINQCSVNRNVGKRTTSTFHPLSRADKKKLNCY